MTQQLSHVIKIGKLNLTILFFNMLENNTHVFVIFHNNLSWFEPF